MDFGKMKLNCDFDSDSHSCRFKSGTGKGPHISSKCKCASASKAENNLKNARKNGDITSKHNYCVRLRPGQYHLSVNWSSNEKPASVTIVPESIAGEFGKDVDNLVEPRAPRRQPLQQPLLYENDGSIDSVPHPSPSISSSSSSNHSSFPRKIVNRFFPSSSSGKGSSPILRAKLGAFPTSRKRHGRCMENRGRHCQWRSKYRVAERKKAEGNELYKKKHYREAIKLYTEAIEMCPDCPSYYSNRSACHMMLTKYSHALSDAREAVRLDASFVKGYIRVAKCNIALGDANAALSVLRQASEIQPSTKAVRDEIVNANRLIRHTEEIEKAAAKKDYRTAIYHIDRALDLAVGCRALRISKAEYLVELQRHLEAQEIVNEILQSDSGNVDAICVRGMCLYYQDNQEAAFTHFQHALKLAPDHRKAKEMYKKAKLLKVKKEEGNQAFNQGKLAEALTLYTEALAIDVNNKTTNSKLYCNRAAVKMKTGQCKEAVDDCTAAINLNDKYVKAYLRRSKCYQELGKHEEAVRDFERICKLDKNQEYTRLLQDAKLQLKCSKRKDYYKILGVSRSATDDDIKKSYKKMALQHHPDRHANASETEKREHEVKFKEIGEAYAVLTDPKKKAMYDRGQDINEPDYGFGHDEVDPNQIFQAFFNSAGSSFNFQQQGFGRGFSSSGFTSGGFPGGMHFQFG